MGGHDLLTRQVGVLSPELRLSQPRPCPLHPCPHLGLPRQSQDLPQVVQEPHKVEPVWEEEEQGMVGSGQGRDRIGEGLQGKAPCLPTQPQRQCLPHHSQGGTGGGAPLSGWACRMPSAVWKAWKELGKSTSGSDSSTSPSSMSTASRTVILL